MKDAFISIETQKYLRKIYATIYLAEEVIPVNISLISRCSVFVSFEWCLSSKKIFVDNYFAVHR